MSVGVGNFLLTQTRVWHLLIILYGLGTGMLMTGWDCFSFSMAVLKELYRSCFPTHNLVHWRMNVVGPCRWARMDMRVLQHVGRETGGGGHQNQSPCHPSWLTTESTVLWPHKQTSKWLKCSLWKSINLVALHLWIYLWSRTCDLGDTSANILFCKWWDISMFRRPGYGLQMFGYSLAPCTLGRCTGVQLRLLFNKWRHNLVFTASERNGHDTIGLMPSYASLWDIVLSCEGRALPHRISQVVLNSVKLRKIQTIRFSFRRRRGWAVESWCWVWCWKWCTQQQYIHSCTSPEEHGCYALLSFQEESARSGGFMTSTYVGTGRPFRPACRR